MTWSDFATVPFHLTGFRTGERFQQDENGLLNLEIINAKLLLQDDAMEMEDELDTGNFPYFRFAVGVKRGELEEFLKREEREELDEGKKLIDVIPPLL